jgi:hypothetical protein
MQITVEDAVSVRFQSMDLLGQQMAVLDSSSKLSDSQLRECYERQCRVRDLREKLQPLSASTLEIPQVSL